MTAVHGLTPDRRDGRLPLFLTLVFLVFGWHAARVHAQDDTAAGSKSAFDILEYQVEGNTVLPTLAIERAVYPFLGPGRSIDDVEKARGALEKAYQKAGFLSVYVDIPEQKVEDGVVRLLVTEGKVERVRVTGNRYFSRNQILAGVPSVQEGNVPDFQRLQAELNTLARTPDRTVTPILKPGTAPGTLDVDLEVKDQLPLHGEIELNNRQTPNTDPLRLQAALRYDNLWQRQHSVSLFYQTAPQETSNLRVISASYALPIGTQGDTLAFYGVKSDSNVAAIGATDVIGKGYIVGVRGVLPLRPVGKYMHSATLGLDYKDFDDTVILGADTFETPVNYAPLSADYSASFPLGKTANNATLSLNTAPRGLFGNNDEEFEGKRVNARASYVYLRGNWSTDVPLNPRTALQFKFQGQLADQALISNEQFCIGGLETVRGYLECEALGDDALVGGIQLTRLLPFSRETGKIDRMTLVAYLEGGMVWVIDPLPEQIADFGLYSIGVGVRAQAYTHFQAALDVALPLATGPYTDRYDPRVLFRLAAQF